MADKDVNAGREETMERWNERTRGRGWWGRHFDNIDYDLGYRLSNSLGMKYPLIQLGFLIAI